MDLLCVTREFTFETAHHLPGHDGLCKNIHGHSYKLFVTILGVPLNEQGNSKDGMVVDFGELKLLVERSVLDELDHTLVLRDSPDSQEVKRVLLKIGVERVLLLPNQPTCENLLLYIKERLLAKLPANLTLSNIKLQETANTSAEWQLDTSNSKHL